MDNQQNGWSNPQGQNQGWGPAPEQQAPQNDPYYPIDNRPTMGFGQAIETCFRKYADFMGRATRAEFWWWYLFNVIVSVVFYFALPDYVGSIVQLALVIPTLAVCWRRLHDIGKAGGWYFIFLIPIVGIILLIIWWCKPSEPFDNRFGRFE